MAHYALLNMANVVTKVIVGPNEDETDTNWELYYQDLFKQVVKRTSYNTSYGKHLKGGIPFRKNYAGKGFVYNAGWICSGSTMVPCGGSFYDRGA